MIGNGGKNNPFFSFFQILMINMMCQLVVTFMGWFSVLVYCCVKVSLSVRESDRQVSLQMWPMLVTFAKSITSLFGVTHDGHIDKM